MSDGSAGSVSSGADALRRTWAWALGGSLAVVVIGFLALCWTIGAGVRSISDRALRECAGEPGAVAGDRVQALMTFLESDRHSFRDRNHAIWALGQLGDRRALRVLEKYATGESRREDLDHELSQYELRKAIRACQGGTNIGAFVWRRGELAAG